MKIIKRNGAEVAFDIDKIIVAITKANESVEEAARMTPLQIKRIARSVVLDLVYFLHGGAPEEEDEETEEEGEVIDE